MGGGLYSSCYCAFTHSYGPPCLSGASHTWKHPATTQHAPSFSHCRPAVSTNPTSYRTWPGAELASVNPGTAFQTKGTSNQIYVGLGLLWNVAVEHVYCVFVCYATVPLCARRAANPPWSLLRVGPNPTGPVYVFTAPFNGSRMRMWSWHADRSNHQNTRSSHSPPTSTPIYTLTLTPAKTLPNGYSKPVPTCPTFIPTKIVPTPPLYIPKVWHMSLKTPRRPYNLTHVQSPPLSLPPVWPVSVDQPVVFGCRLIYLQ